MHRRFGLMLPPPRLWRCDDLDAFFSAASGVSAPRFLERHQKS